MTDNYIPRKNPILRNLNPNSPRERNRVRAIKDILSPYVVGGTEEDLHLIAVEIWRQIKR